MNGDGYQASFAGSEATAGCDLCDSTRSIPPPVTALAFTDLLEMKYTVVINSMTAAATPIAMPAIAAGLRGLGDVPGAGTGGSGPGVGGPTGSRGGAGAGDGGVAGAGASGLGTGTSGTELESSFCMQQGASGRSRVTPVDMGYA